MVIIKRMPLVRHLMTPQMKRMVPNVKTKDAVCTEPYDISDILLYVNI